MARLISKPDPEFVRAIQNGLEHWCLVTKNLEAESIAELDSSAKNLFRILDFGLQLSDLWELTATVMVQAFRLPDRRGYWRLWLEKLDAVIANSPNPNAALSIRLLIQYGKLQRSLSQLEKAIKIHHVAMQHAQNLRNDELLAYVLLELGWDYLWGNDLDKAQLFGEKALHIHEIGQGVPIIHLVDTLRALGSVENRRGEVDQAIKLLKRALHHARVVGFPISIARSYIDLGIVYRRKREYPEALDCLGNAAEVLTNTIYENDKISVFLNIGTIYFDQEMWEAAEITFNKANNRYLRESGDLLKQALLWNNLGNVYLKQGKLEEAEKYLRDAVALWPRISNEIQWANTLATLAEVCILQARRDESKRLIKEAMEKVEKFPYHASAKEIKDELESLQKRIAED